MSLFNSYELAPPDEDVRLALDRDSGRHLIVEIGSVVPAYSSDGPISERVRQLTFNDHTRSFLDVELLDRSMKDEFDVLICDVLAGLPSSRGRAQDVHERLGKWRSLLRLAQSRRMDPQRRIGLFGELTFLATLAGNIPEPWRYWKGPTGNSHDFEFLTGCIEVKTTTLGSTSVRIHGLNQLLPDENALGLLIYTVSESEIGKSLGALIDELTATFDSPAFEALVARAGWSRGLEDGESYVVEEHLFVPVSPQVPRLVPDSVPGGVFGVDYDVELELLRPHAENRQLLSLARGML